MALTRFGFDHSNTETEIFGKATERMGRVHDLRCNFLVCEHLHEIGLCVVVQVAFDLIYQDYRRNIKPWLPGEKHEER